MKWHSRQATCVISVKLVGVFDYKNCIIHWTWQRTHAHRTCGAVRMLQFGCIIMRPLLNKSFPLLFFHSPFRIIFPHQRKKLDFFFGITVCRLLRLPFRILKWNLWKREFVYNYGHMDMDNESLNCSQNKRKINRNSKLGWKKNIH